MRLATHVSYIAGNHVRNYGGSFREFFPLPETPAGNRGNRMSVDIGTLTLTSGSHRDRSDGVCLMEAVAWWAGEAHTDAPECASPVLTSFGQSLNDRLPADKRQELKAFIPAIAGTRGDGLDERRGYLALDWFIRTYTPAWLELAGLAGEAAQLRGLQPVTDMTTARAAAPAVTSARAKAAAARDAAGDAAWAAAGDAARDKLAPTVSSLQDSAVALFGTMVTLSHAEDGNPGGVARAAVADR